MRRDAPANLVYEGRWTQAGDLVLTLPSIDREAVTRIAIVDVDAERTLGDSARGEEVVALDEEGIRVRMDLGIDISKPRRITLRQDGRVGVFFRRAIRLSYDYLLVTVVRWRSCRSL
jgi:hypothetical protein